MYVSGGIYSTAPRRPDFLVSPKRDALSRVLWAFPLILSLLLVGIFLLWVRVSDQAEREEQRRVMVLEASALETHLQTPGEADSAALAALAILVQRSNPMPQADSEVPALPEVSDGLRRFWQSITWLDARKYDVRLVNGRGRVLASTVDTTLLPAADVAAALSPSMTYRINFKALQVHDVYLELTPRAIAPPWYRTLPIGLILGAIMLIAIASAMLRRQMQEVTRAERAWRTESVWRTAIEESIVVGLRGRDFNGRLVYVNRAFADMVGRSAEELMGLLPPMPYWPSNNSVENMRNYERNMAGLAPPEGYESLWQHSDGHLFEVMVFESPLIDATGMQIGWMGSVLDISERKRLEERERKQTETLAHHARLTMLGEVAATLAHELNQPLTAIMSYNTGVINLLRPVESTKLDPEALRALESLGEQARHAGRIVHRIREFLTRRAPEREACDLNLITQRAIDLMGRELQRHNVILQFNAASHLPPVVADPVLVEQVLINLIRNACDALAENDDGMDGDKGGDAPGQHIKKIHIQVRAAGNKFARIDVTDNATGLKGKTIESLCQPFFTTKTEGMGMGLAICRSIIEAHQGVRDASDVTGGGACFSLSLPLMTPASSKDTLTQTPAPALET